MPFITPNHKPYNTMEPLAYLAIIIASYFVSIWTWNRAAAIGGNATREGAATDYYFAISVALLVWAFKTLA